VRTPRLVVADDSHSVAELRRRYPAALLLVLLAAPCDARRALDQGADAVTPLGAPAELRARVRALLRRAAGVAPATAVVGPLSIDFERHVVRADGAPLQLRPREFTLLACLASDPGRVFSKRELLAACWKRQQPPAHSRALEAQISRLRRRLGPHGRGLVTVWSVGYLLTPAR
jgi:DNA-binding response OmpR family regulator